MEKIKFFIKRLNEIFSELMNLEIFDCKLDEENDSIV